MPKLTPKIRYSLKDRGRMHTGKPRNFNIRALYDYINGDACQEVVSSRGMVGFYGHWPRIRFGMNPTEGGLDSGKPVAVEPAFVTTHLSIDMDGVVEHVAEFLDTVSGRLAEKLFGSEKVGGFSSAIGDDKFYGFDYVMEPNYLGNSFRGVSLDDAVNGDIGTLTYAEVYTAEMEEHAQQMSKLLDNIAAERNTFNEITERLQDENEELISFLAKQHDVADVLDSVKCSDGFINVSLDSTQQMSDDIDAFKKTDLVIPAAPTVKVKEDVAYQQVLRRSGHR